MYIIEHSYKIGKEYLFWGDLKLKSWTSRHKVRQENESSYEVEHENEDDYTFEVYKSFNEDELSLNVPVYLTMNDSGAIRFTVYTLNYDVQGLRKALDCVKEKISEKLEQEQEEIKKKLEHVKSL